MEPPLSFHPLVQRDFNEIVDCYHEEAGSHGADWFESEFRESIHKIKVNPRRFPSYRHKRRYRRHTLRTVPHLILFLESADAIRIMVMKHIKRNPAHGLRRK
jgi:plasmid stabilization system protein ParE